MSGKTPRVYFINKKELEAVINDVAGTCTRAEALVRDFYVNQIPLQRTTLILLMELIVACERFSVLLEESLKLEKLVRKEGEAGYHLTEKELTFMADLSAMNRDIKRNLKELGLVLDLQ